MDKVTRMLFLYSKLLSGEQIDKQVFCNETGCSMRTFDRDIEDMRLFFSEAFIADELIYDRNLNVYRLNKQKHLRNKK